MTGNTRRLAHVLLLGVLTLVLRGAHADTWSYEPTITERSFEFGTTQVVLVTDARTNRQFPDFILKIFRGKELQAQYRGITFDQIFAAPDHSVFVGLSNRGIPGTAAVIFNKAGELLLLATHGAAEFDYCTQSVTLRREWYDAENPQVKFVFSGADPGIFLRDCKGGTVELVDVVQKAYARAVEMKRLHKERAR